ncbi:glycine zipper family protein [Magnetospira sp. QH-2]|uniref:glycine zipper family protein n=1 Tax=Magnetospira sp. (strain QH-2) TaxID=1288970 RepID=UPI0003E80D1A|nr:glycine zipper family protein [Magnetospira sp. QH-2]CCQ72409.1 Conserved protein of unknown function [Magnetospira sp. QH-2]
MRPTLPILIAALALGACSTTAYDPPRVDMKTVKDPQALQKDMIECQSLAEMGTDGVGIMMSTTATLTAGSTVASGLFGSANYAAGTAGALGEGMLVGLIAGPIGAQFEETMYKNFLMTQCLQVRCHKVTGGKYPWGTPDGWCHSSYGGAVGIFSPDLKKECVAGRVKLIQAIADRCDDQSLVTYYADED